jgi:hypothetical protein
VPYHTPHTLRRTLARLGERLCTTPEEMKAWSQNLGHDEVLTTLTSYGAVPRQRQAELIGSLATTTNSSDNSAWLLQRIEALVSQERRTRK